MKKVSLAVGAVGVAPVLGLMVPAAAAAAVHEQAGTAMTASQLRGKTVRLHDAVAASCTGRDSTKKLSRYHSLTVWVYHTPSNGCIGGVSGYLTAVQGGLSMRTRAYKISTHGVKTQVYSHYHNGNEESGRGTFFYQGIHATFGGVTQQVCAALVSTGNHAVVNYGPVCVSFSA